jgi:hypothetical protein
MKRAKLGRLGVGRVAVVACAGALGVAGCGGASSSSSSTSTSGSHPSASAAAFQPVLGALDVSGPAYTSAVYSGAPDLTSERAAITKMRASVYGADLAVRKLKAPATAQRALVTYLTQSGKLVAALDHLYQEPSTQAIAAHLPSMLSPNITSFVNAETSLRARLGLPRTDPWLGPQPLGPTIYTDSLSGPHGKVKWLMGSNVRYAAGGLELSAAARRNGLTGPSTPYTFDSRHIAVQIDERTLKGDPYVGIMCAPLANVSNTNAVGQIGPWAQWSIGVLRLNSPGYLLNTPTASKAIKVGQTNHLRVDCDEWRPGLTTVRVYVNGEFMGSSSGAFSLQPTREAGVAIVSPKTASLVKFTNWQVSKLGH